MNILWIITTQWRAQACGYSGNADVHTPSLDALARHSLQFTQAVTPHPFGPFARAALLTGVESPANGLTDYFDALPTDARTMADLLSERGYRTSFFGKWHLGKRDPLAPLVGETHARTIVPVDARGGFDFWEGFESGFQLNDPWLHGTRLPSPVQFHGYQSDVLCTRAADWIATQDRTPWFSVVSLEPPHPPYDSAPAGYTINPEVLSLPVNVPRTEAVERKARRELSGYYAQISATDLAIGALFQRIDSATTAVVFTSVHGDMHGAHGLFRKGWPYEESVRVPLLIRVPGRGGDRRDDPVSLTQLPELTVGLVDRGEIPVCRPAWARISMPSVVNLPYQGDRVWRGIRTPQRKLIVTEDGPWLFFDLAKDPYELNNLVGVADCEEEIRSWQEKLNQA